MTMQTKPLRATQAVTKRPSAASAHTPASIDNYEPHSRDRARASHHYHEVVVGKTATGQYGDKAVESLNPTQAAPAVRSFPGLANG